MSSDVFQRVAVVNVGLDAFGQAVRDQGAEAVDVDWRPPAGGAAGAVALLAALWGRHGERVEAANAAAVERIEKARPRAGYTPKARKKSSDTRRPRTYSASAAPTRLPPAPPYPE